MSRRRNRNNLRPVTITFVRDEPRDPERERQLEEFRQMFREAYPDAAKFIESIHVIPRKLEFYFDNGGIACNGFVSARGINRYDHSSDYESEKGKDGR